MQLSTRDLQSMGIITPKNYFEHGKNKTTRFSGKFYEKAIKEALQHDANYLQIDLAAHSLWGHFRPDDGPSKRKLNQDFDKMPKKYLDMIDRLKLEGDFWPLLNTELEKNDNLKLHFRVLLILPRSAQSDIIINSQERTKFEGQEQRRYQGKDPYLTLFTIRRLMNCSEFRDKLRFDVYMLKNRMISYSIARIGRNLLVGFYNYNSLLDGRPCAWYRKEGDSYYFDLYANEINVHSQDDDNALIIDFESSALKSLDFVHYKLFERTMADYIEQQLR